MSEESKEAEEFKSISVDAWQEVKTDDNSWYGIGAVVTGIIAFFAIWIYAFVVWGFLMGLAIGWLPAIIGAFIIGALWPLMVVLLAGLILFILSKL